MPWVDPRTDRLVPVWVIRAGDDIVDALYVTSASERDRWPADQHLGRLFYLRADPVRGALAVRRDSLTPLNTLGLGEQVVGYTLSSPGEALNAWSLLTSSRRDQEAFLGYAYDAPRTNGAIHSAERVVSYGDHVLKFNEAAGGYLHSWQVAGVEILNRGNTWGRGLQQQLEFVDVTRGRVVLHRPSQAGCLYNSGLGALGSIMVSLVESSPPQGGRMVTIETIPLELDPGGLQSLPGVSSDHGGDDVHPVLWTDVRVRTQLWLDYNGTPGLHRLATTWDTPFAVQSAWFDCAAQTCLCLRGTFDQVVVRDHGLGVSTDVSAAVDAVDFRRWQVSTAGTFEDQPVPASASTLVSGFGGVYARNTATDLTVFLAGRLHAIDAGAMDLSLADVPRGTQATYLTSRTGGTGFDQAQVVMLGLDTNLTGRWYDHDQVRRIPNGAVTYTRWLSIGTLAQALAQASAIPASY